MTESQPAKRIAVVGAGAAGLAAARNLLAVGQEVVIYEKGSHIGGLWVYGNDSGRSAAYRSLHINSEARDTGFRDFPLDETQGLFPTHEGVARYLQAYADKHGLRERVRFGSEVTEVAPQDGGWRVTLAGGAAESFDAVVVANGHQAAPRHPGFAGDFAGEYSHAFAYRTPEPFAGKRVLVIGVGNSGLDIAADVSSHAAITGLAARSPVLIMPRMFLGWPISRFFGRWEKSWMPWPLRRRLRETVTRLVHGRMEDYGFVTPKKKTHPATHSTIFYQIAGGRVRVHPGVASVEGREVRFTDGTRAEYDAMIAATGYEVDLPFLAPELSPMRDGRVDLYRRVVHPDHPGLYFVGLFDVSGGANIRMMDIQSRWLREVVAGRIPLPGRDEMIAHYKAEQDRMAQDYPSSARYGLELDPREYGLALREDRQKAGL